MSNSSKTVVVRDVEFHWANVHKPVSPFGQEQYETQVRTKDEDTMKALVDAGVNMKPLDDGGWKGNVKRRTVAASGEPLDPPKVLDGSKEPLTTAIGNGSTGHLKLFTYDISKGPMKGKKGAMLSAIMVTDLVVYESGGEDF